MNLGSGILVDVPRKPRGAAHDSLEGSLRLLPYALKSRSTSFFCRTGAAGFGGFFAAACACALDILARSRGRLKLSVGTLKSRKQAVLRKGPK